MCDLQPSLRELLKRPSQKLRRALAEKLKRKHPIFGSLAIGHVEYYHKYVRQARWKSNAPFLSCKQINDFQKQDKYRKKYAFPLVK